MLIHSPKELALYVGSYRKKLGLSQAEIGNRVGLKQKTISAFENKPESTQLETLFKVLAAVNLDLRIVPKEKSTADEAKWSLEW